MYRVVPRNPKGQFTNELKGELHPNWKKDGKLSYWRIHKWVNKVAGHPTMCEVCKKDFPPRQMHWSSKDHKYERNLEDWQRLCIKCHKDYDRAKFGITGGRHKKHAYGL